MYKHEGPEQAPDDEEKRLEVVEGSESRLTSTRFVVPAVEYQSE